MTLTEFKKSRKLMSTKLFEEEFDIPDIHSPFVFKYAGNVYIEFNPRKIQPFYLILDWRNYISGDLHFVEEKLYEFSRDEGFLDYETNKIMDYHHEEIENFYDAESLLKYLERYFLKGKQIILLGNKVTAEMFIETTKNDVFWHENKEGRIYLYQVTKIK